MKPHTKWLELTVGRKEQGRYPHLIYNTSSTSALVISSLFPHAILCVFMKSFIYFSLSFFARETNLKFKMGLRVTDERLQEERQLAAYDGECRAL